MQRLAAVFCPALLAIFVCATSMDAQVSTASLTGTVLDRSGAVVPDARIVVTQTETNFATDTQSGPDGLFTFASIP